MSKDSAKKYITGLFSTTSTHVGEIMMLGVIKANNDPNLHTADDLNKAMEELHKEGVIDGSNTDYIKRLK